MPSGSLLVCWRRGFAHDAVSLNVFKPLACRPTKNHAIVCIIVCAIVWCLFDAACKS